MRSRLTSFVAAIFLLKARHGYREGVVLEQQSNVRVTFDIPGALTPDNYRKLVTLPSASADD